jgi:hypothetical protein
MSNLHNIPLNIANIFIDLISPLSAAELGIEPRLGPFFGEPDNPVARVSLRWEESDGAPSPCGELIFDMGFSWGFIWRMYRDGKEYYAAISYPSGMQGVLHANATWDDVTLAEQRTGVQWQSLLNIGAGELIFRTAILFSGGLVFHSSGLDDNGRGIVFIGHSGAGKSTQVGLWSQEPGVIAMNEDRIAVRVEAGCPMCYGTPWGGTADTARNHAAPLAALIMLEQAPENTIQPIQPAAAASMLAARAFLPYWDQSLMSHAMANLNAILERVPVYLLRCRPEPAVVSLVRSVL